MPDNTFVRFDLVYVKSVIDEHLKGLSPSQRAEALAWIVANKDRILQGLDDGLRLILDDWQKMKNGESN